MPTKFDRRFQQRGTPQQTREHGVVATMDRKGLQTAAFMARRMFGRQHEAMGQEIGLAIKVEKQSWLVPISACFMSGEKVTPQKGDKLLIDGEKWEVHAPDDGTPASEKHVGGYYWVVHTRITND